MVDETNKSKGGDVISGYGDILYQGAKNWQVVVSGGIVERRNLGTRYLIFLVQSC